MMRAITAMVALVAACRHPELITQSASSPFPDHRVIALDQSPKARARIVQAEVLLRAYLMWFGDLAPREAFLRARGANLFDQWSAYLAALGLPNHHVDAPRVSQSNTVMLATLGRLGEALCVRSVEHDLHKNTPPDARTIFAFDPIERPTRDEFGTRFDVLHRTFLSYPASLAPQARTDRFFKLHRQVSSNHSTRQPLSPDEMGWVAVCTALVQHPEAGIY